ncbi:hypothetical protein ACFY5J_25905 [Peribacillus butanolivorans]|uniref:hypothetical protein n=1 Tax=Peribacillus butanolivorans TaxID=421767 RepID=UPI0036BC5DF1
MCLTIGVQFNVKESTFEFAAHSLRSGLWAAMMGMTDNAIMKQTGHKTREIVGRYVFRLGHVIKITPASS